MMPPSPRLLACQARHPRLANRFRSRTRTMINPKHVLSMKLKMNTMRFNYQ